MNRPAFVSALMTALLCASMVAQAQSAPPIKILVGFPPGGSTDTVARVLAEKMSVVLKQTIIVDNKPGAGGRLAAQALKASAPDGLTYMIAPNATPVFQTLLYPPEVLKYDMLQDFAPVGVVVSYPLALAVGQHTGVKTAKDYQTCSRPTPRTRASAPQARAATPTSPACSWARPWACRSRPCPTAATARWSPTCWAARCRPG